MFELGVLLLKQVRKHKIPTILGGVFATFAPDLALSFDEIDIVFTSISPYNQFIIT